MNTGSKSFVLVQLFAALAIAASCSTIIEVCRQQKVNMQNIFSASNSILFLQIGLLLFASKILVNDLSNKENKIPSPCSLFGIAFTWIPLILAAYIKDVNRLALFWMIGLLICTVLLFKPIKPREPKCKNNQIYLEVEILYLVENIIMFLLLGCVRLFNGNDVLITSCILCFGMIVFILLDCVLGICPLKQCFGKWRICVGKRGAVPRKEG